MKSKKLIQKIIDQIKATVTRINVFSEGENTKKGEELFKVFRKWDREDNGVVRGKEKRKVTG